MRITQLVTLRDFRNYEQAKLDLPDGLTIVHGPVGTGKTNLLEGLYFACTGRSCRTSNERELVRFGQKVTRAGIVSSNGTLERRFEVALEFSPSRTKSVRADGQQASSMADIDDRPLVCVFLPDRMELVKGPAGGRRAHLDAFIAALWPTREATRKAYARALAQRNVLVGRIRNGAASRTALTSWDRELATCAIDLIADRRSAVEQLHSRFESRAAELGLPQPATLTYRPKSSAESADEFELELQQAIDNDLVRGFTTHGPHRDDLRLESDRRDLRRYGSQGQQRLGLLALLLAERDALQALRDDPPLLLLDDVLSELDVERRERLAQAVSNDGQTLISTADLDAADSLGPNATRLRVDSGQLVG